MKTKQYFALRTRLAIVLIILAALFAAGISTIIYIDFSNELQTNLRRRLENITTLASLQQDGDELLKVQAQGDESFNRIQERNARIKRSDPDLIFVYTLRKDEQGIYFVVDARLTPDEALISNYGDRYEQPSETLVANFDSMSRALIEPEIYTDEFGSFLSGYAPIFTSNGEQVGVLGVDISADTILEQQRRYLIRLIIIFLASLPFMVLSGIVSAYYLAKPIINLRDTARKISRGDFNVRITNMPKTRELAELAHDLNAMTDNLGGLINDLEQRVAERTAGLTRKAGQLRAVSYIARQTAEVQSLASILDLVVNLVTEQFNYYHAGIFLINEAGDEAILQAASSEGGKRMVERKYSLKVGAQGIVGHVATQKRARIALESDREGTFFDNADLPMTRSEVALPLMIHNRVLGVLDIQTDQPQAFQADDIDVLQTLADQVAVAIENAQLLGEAQAALRQLETVSASRTQDAWNQRLQGQSLAFTYTPLGIHAEAPSNSMGEDGITAPITLRGQKIGSILMNRKDDANWGKYDEDLIDEVAYQVGLAVDNLRLLEDAQQRARQEQTIGELAIRFSQALDIDSLLQAAARELGQMPDVSEVSVFIGQLPEQPPQKRRSKRLLG